MAHLMLAHAVPHLGRRGMRQKVRRLTPVRPSYRAELEYRAALMQVIRPLEREGAALVAALRFGWPPAIGDELPGAPRRATDADVSGEVEAALREAGARMVAGIQLRARRLARAAVARSLGTSDERLVRAIRDSVSIDVSPLMTPHGDIGAALTEATIANVDLITSIPEKYLGLVRAAVTEAYATGQRWESLAPLIQRIGGTTEYRARFIARDQTAKMSGAFTRIRQLDLGITEYQWLTAEDERVRDSHERLDLTFQRWDSPPDVDGRPLHPGEDFQCRCVPKPVFRMAPAAEDPEDVAEAA